MQVVSDLRGEAEEIVWKHNTIGKHERKHTPRILTHSRTVFVPETTKF